MTITRYPQSITVTTLHPCNAQCLFCHPLKAEHTRADLDEVLLKLDEAIARTGELAFCGWGEFLLMPGVAAYLETLNQRYPEVYKKIVTNGCCFTPEIIEALLAGKYRLDISLHAACAETHALLTRTDKFAQIIATLEELLSRRDPERLIINIIYVLNRANMYELPAMAKLVSDLGTDHLRVDYMYITSPDNLTLSCLFDNIRIEPIFDQTIAVASDLGVALDLPPRFVQPTVPVGRKKGLAPGPPEMICREPFISLRLTMNGFVVPCCGHGAGLFLMGNINEQSFREIWFGEKWEGLRRQIRDGNPPDVCRNCQQTNTTNVMDLTNHIHATLFGKMVDYCRAHPQEFSESMLYQPITDPSGITAKMGEEYRRLMVKGYGEYLRELKNEGKFPGRWEYPAREVDAFVLAREKEYDARWRKNNDLIMDGDQVTNRGLIIRLGPLHEFDINYYVIERAYPDAVLDMVTTGGLQELMKKKFPKIDCYFTHARGWSLVKTLWRLSLDDYNFIIVTGTAWFPNLVLRALRPQCKCYVIDGYKWSQLI